MIWLSDSIHRCCLSFGFCAGFWDTQILHIPSVVFFSLLVHFIYWVTLSLLRAGRNPLDSYLLRWVQIAR